MTRKYPLDPLRRVRAEKVDLTARALSDAVRNADRARVETERRQEIQRQVEQSLALMARAEEERLERGELTATDLARGAAWGVAAEMARATHRLRVEEAKAGHALALSQAKDKQKELAEARATAEVVERHYQQWHRGRQAEALAFEQDNAEEAHLARMRGAR